MLGTNSCASGGHNPSCPSLSVPLPCISKLHAGSIDYTGLVLHARSAEEYTPRPEPRLSHLWSSCFRGSSNEPKLISQHSTSISNSRKERSFCIAVLLGRAADALGTQQPDSLLQAWLAVDQAATYALIAAERCATDGKAFQLQLQTNPVGCETATPVGQNPSLRPLSLPQRLLLADLGEPHGFLLIQSCKLEVGPSSDGSPCAPRPAVLIRPAARPPSLSSPLAAPPPTPPATSPTQPADTRRTRRKPDSSTQRLDIPATGVSSSTNALTRAYTGVGPFVAEPASCLTGASSSAALQEAPAAVPLSLAAPAEPSSQLHGWGPGAVWVTALEYGPQLVTVLRYPGNVLYQNSNSRDYWGDLSALPLAGPRLLALLLAAERTPGGPQHDAAATSLIEEQLAGLVTRLVGGEVVSTLVHLPPSMAGAVAHSTSPWAPPHTPHMLPSAHKPGAAPSTATDTTAVKPRDGDSVAVPAIDGSLEPQRTLAAAASASISPAVAAAAAGRGGSGPVCDPVDRQLLAALMCDEPSVRGGVSNQHSSIPTEMAELCQQKPNNVPLSRDLLSVPLRTLKYSAVLNNGSGGRLEGWGSADAVTTGGSKYGVGAGAGLGVSRLMGVGATIDELANVNMSNEAGVEREQAALIPDTSLGIIVGGAEGDEDSMEAAADVTFACLAQPSERQSSVHCDRIVGSSQTSAAAAAAVSARNGIPTFGTVSCLLPYFSLPVEPAPAIPSSPPPASTADVSGPLPHSGMDGLQSSSMPPPQPRRKRFTTSALPQTLQRLMDAAAAAASNHKRRQPLRRLVSDLSAASTPNPSLLKLTAGLQPVQTLPPRRRAALADAVARPSSQPVLPPPLPPPPARMAATLASSDTLARATIGAADEYRKRAPVSVVFEEAFPVVEPAAPAAEPQLDCAILSLDKTPLPPPSSIIDTTACGERTAFLDSIQSAELPPCLAKPHGGNQPCLADDPDVSSLCGASPPPCPPFAPRRSFDMSCLYEADGNTKWYGNGGDGYGMAGRPGTATGRLPMRFSRDSCSGNTRPVVGAAGVSEQHGTGAGHAAHPRIRNRVQTSVSGRSRRPLLHTDTQGRVQMLLSNFTQRLEQQQQQRQQQQQQQYELQRQRLQQQQLQQQQFRRSSYRGPVSCDGGTMMRLTRPSDAGGLTETATIQSPHRRQRAATVTSIECESPSHASKGKQRLLEGVAWRLDEDGKMVAEPTALEERRGKGEYAEGSGNGSGCGGGSSSSSGLGLGNAVGDTSSASHQLPELVPQTLSSPAQGPLGSGTPETPSLWHQVHIRVQPETSVHVSEARAPEDSGIVISSGGGGGVGGVTLDPAPGAPPPLLLVVTQVDVTPLVEAQLRTANLLQQEHRVLESIFPRHCIEYLTLRGHMTAGTCSGAAGEATAATAAATSGQRNPDRSAQDASSGTSIPAKLASLATWHPGVTILFCDIVGFTTASHSASAFAVMGFLNELYSRFDALVDIYKVYKVETIGDCYMVAGGLVAYDEDGYKSVISGGEDPLHAVRVMEFSKAMLRTASGVRMPHTGKPVQLRVGLHSGPVTSGVVGDRMPRFCLFGDTVNTASRMESTCRPGAIHVSAATQALLPRESWVDLGCSEVKGKGQMRTFEWAGQADDPFESGQMQRVLGLYL